MKTKQVQVNIHEAKTHLSVLVHRSTRGEKIVIARDGVPLVKLVPVKKINKKPRVFGQLKGKIKVREDFTVPLSDAELHDAFGDALT